MVDVTLKGFSGSELRESYFPTAETNVKISAYRHGDKVLISIEIEGKEVFLPIEVLNKILVFYKSMESET